MSKDHIFFLGKVFSKESYAEEFVSKGKFICNTLNFFKNYEDKEKNNIGDIFEGMGYRITPNSGAKLNMGGHDIDYKELHFHSNRHLNLNAFCLYGPNAKEDENITIDSVKNLIRIQEDAKNLGEYFVVIHKVDEFIRRMNQKLNTLGFSFRSHCVEYKDLSEDFHIQSDQIGFIKAKEFSHQKEFRYLIDTGCSSSAPIFIEIGSISDIAFKMKIIDFNKYFEVKLAENT